MIPQNVYHGILVDASFKNISFPKTFKVFAKRKSVDMDWFLYGIEVPESQRNKAIKSIQKNLKSDQPYYTHLYNDRELIVIFKSKVFYTPAENKISDEIVAFGKLLGIPDQQLNIKPTSFQDEKTYFKPEDFIH